MKTKQTSAIRRFAGLLLMLALCLAVRSGVQAQTSGTWTNNAAGNWSTAVNWTGGAIASGIDAVATFADTRGTNTITLDQAYTVGSLVFINTNYNLTGNSILTLATSTGNPVIQVKTNFVIFGIPLSSSQMVSITNTTGAAYSYVLTNQANNFAGGLTFQASQATFFTTNSTNVLSLGGAPTVNLGAYVGSGQMGFNISATNVANSLTNADGSPSLVLTNNFNVQTIRLIFDQTIGYGNAQPVNIAGNVYLNAGSANVRDIYPFNAPLTISGVLSGGTGYGLILNGNSPLILHNSGNSFIGGITYSAGNILSVNSDGAMGYAGNGLKFSTANGTLRIDAPFTTARDFNLVANAIINVQTNLLEIDNGFSTSIHGAGNLTVQGVATNGGELLLTGGNTFSGALTISGGVLANGSGSSLATAGNASVANGAVWTCDSVSFPNIPLYTINKGGTLIFSNSTPNLSGTANLVDNGTLDVSAVTGGFSLASGQTLLGSGVVTGAVTAASGSIIIPGTTGGAGTLTIASNLTLNGQAIQFDLTNAVTEGAGTNDEIIVGNNLTLSGGEVIRLNYLTGSLAAGTYKLINYSGTLTGTFALGSAYPNVTLNNGGVTPGYISITVGTGGSSAAPLIWKGDGSANVWDQGTTANWVPTLGGTPQIYSDPSMVTFNDWGSNNVPVALNVTVYPGQAAFNMTNNSYTLSGSGAIAGSAALTITGGKNLTNLLQNSYNGGTTIYNGSKLVLGNGGTTGAAGSGTINLVTNGQLVVNESGSLTLAQQVTGSAGSTPQIVQVGSGTTTLSGTTDNTYLNATVNSGTLVLAKSSAAAIHAITNATVNGGTLQLAGSGGDQIANGAIVTLAGGTFDVGGKTETFKAMNGYGSILDSAGGGTLTLTNPTGMTVSGGTLNLNANITFSAGAPGFQVNSGGILNMMGGTVANGSSASLGVNTGGIFNQTGGALNTTTYFVVGSGGAAAVAANASFNGGTFANTGEFLQGFGGPAFITFGGNASLSLNNFSYGNNTLTNYFYGGTVAANVIHQRGSGNWVGIFSGSTIQAKSTRAQFFPDTGTFYTNQLAYISTNGVTFDCQSFNIGISQNFLHDPALGTNVDGGITKIGTGTLTLTGTNTFNGSLTNNAGTLAFNNNGAYNNVFVGDNAVNLVNLVAAGTSLTNATLTLGSSGSGTQGLTFNLGTFGTPTAPLITVNGTVTNTGNVVITLVAPVLSPASIPLMQYGSMDAANFTATWSVAAFPYVTLTLTNDTAHKLVSVMVVPGVTPKWKGNNGSAWDTTTFNWTSNGVAATYNEPTPPGQPVTFDDTASTFTVDISTATVNPLFISMTNSAHDYIVTGSLGIGGTGSLFKSGTGTLLLSNTPAANTYSGISTITGGALVVGAPNLLSPNSTMTFNSSTLNLGTNNQAIGSLTLNNTPLIGTGTLTGNGGVLTFNNNSSFTLGVALAGNLPWNQNGSGEITLTNTSTYTGAANINSGSVRVQNGSALGVGGFTGYTGLDIANGGRAVLDGSFTTTKGINFAGTGPDGGGALVVTNGNVVDNGSPCQVKNPGATIYVAAGSSMDFQGQSGGNAATLYGATYTKTGPGDLLVGGLPGNTSTANGIISQGRLVGTNCTVGGFITVNSGGTVSGNGPFTGGLNVLAGGTIAPNMYGTTTTMATTIGVTNAGNITLQVNKTATVTNADKITCTATFVNTGTITVTTNIGMTVPFAAGDSFALFTLTNYSALAGVTPTLPVLPSSLAWTNKLAINGTIAVVANGPGIFTNPTGIASFTLSGTSLVINGTNGQAGDAYYLLGTTNLALPVSQWTALWTNVPGTSGNYTFTATNVVVPGADQQYYILSNTNN